MGDKADGLRGWPPALSNVNIQRRQRSHNHPKQANGQRQDKDCADDDRDSERQRGHEDEQRQPADDPDACVGRAAGPTGERTPYPDRDRRTRRLAFSAARKTLPVRTARSEELGRNGRARLPRRMGAGTSRWLRRWLSGTQFHLQTFDRLASLRGKLAEQPDETFEPLHVGRGGAEIIEAQHHCVYVRHKLLGDWQALQVVFHARLCLAFT